MLENLPDQSHLAVKFLLQFSGANWQKMHLICTREYTCIHSSAACPSFVWRGKQKGKSLGVSSNNKLPAFSLYSIYNGLRG